MAAVYMFLVQRHAATTGLGEDKRRFPLFFDAVCELVLRSLSNPPTNRSYQFRNRRLPLGQSRTEAPCAIAILLMCIEPVSSSCVRLACRPPVLPRFHIGFLAVYPPDRPEGDQEITWLQWNQKNSQFIKHGGGKREALWIKLISG